MYALQEVWNKGQSNRNSLYKKIKVLPRVYKSAIEFNKSETFVYIKTYL